MWAGSVRACVRVCVRACEETLTAGAFNQRKNTLEPGQNQVLAKTKRTPAKNARRRTFFTHTRTNTQTRNGERRQRTAFGRRVRCVSWAEPGLRVDRAAGIFSFAHAQRSRRGAVRDCTPSRCSGCAGVFSRAADWQRVSFLVMDISRMCGTQSRRVRHSHALRLFHTTKHDSHRLAEWTLLRIAIDPTSLPRLGSALDWQAILRLHSLFDSVH